MVTQWIGLYPYVNGTCIADGFAGHFILADRCLFKLHHHILSESGERYRVSTVGLYPDELGIASPEYPGRKWGEFGWSGYLFETMVFKEESDSDGHMIMLHNEFEMDRSLTSIDATRVHYNLVRKYMEM